MGLVKVDYCREDGVIKSAVVKDTQINDIKVNTSIHIVAVKPADKEDVRDYILK